MITKIVIDNKFTFTFKKFWWMIDSEDRVRVAMFSDGYVWAFEPKVHVLDTYLEPLRDWFRIIYPNVKDKMCSRAFSLMAQPKMDDFAFNCLKTNRVNTWGELNLG